jgi:hypothetical protein
MFKELAPPDRAGLIDMLGVNIVNDGHAYAYGYLKRISRLFVVHGVGLTR